MSTPRDLEGRTALVTGGARGIGREIALELGRHGASVSFCYRSRDAEAAEVSALLSSMGAANLAARCDVSRTDEVQAFVAQVEATLGPVDILVNNAGIARDRAFLFLDDDAWNEVIGVNLTGTFQCTRMVLRGMMLRKWGRIINVVSASAHIGPPGQTSYSASKSGVVGLTRTLAREAAPFGVLVNAVSPGFIESELTSGLDAKARSALLDRVALRRPGRPEDVAAVVAFLASDRAGYITAQVINVDGGLF